MGFIDNNNVLKLLGENINPGASIKINFNTAKLYTTTAVEVPIIIERSKKPGPTVLITGGIHGDEINGVEIVRQLIAKGINKPERGTIICIPVVNVFGFLNMTREFPDGRDLNRMFPGSKKGPLASRIAYQFKEEVLPAADYCLDFHTGGSSRFNAAQIRIRPEDDKLLKLAEIFHAPFTVYSKNISKSYRDTCAKMGIPFLLFEGGKSQDSNKDIAKHGVEGTLRFLSHLGMLRKDFTAPKAITPNIIINETSWMRAKYSGLLHVKIPIGKYVEKGEYIAIITDPYGSFRHKVKATATGYIINVNQSPIVYQGDAIFHLSKS
ncbi:succinylglutamate desuccinylase/aspartoacylase family protein [Mesonia aquimarina]|uniref:succinylglutamate desuccinylase/aspartoacylase family protein n=1 Tax=Mesonia aquimarina TaxID=1504967 RepID=UPI000EF58A73|nr:succinylglutamate desuccinylase/aspartoacylase family protein [Mesonia aquimarina]